MRQARIRRVLERHGGRISWMTAIRTHGDHQRISFPCSDAAQPGARAPARGSGVPGQLVHHECVVRQRSLTSGQCHNLGTVIETIPIKQQGPDY